MLTFPARQALAVLLTALAMACGARSPLVADHRESAVGGGGAAVTTTASGSTTSGSSSSSTAMGGGGAGGSEPVCGLWDPTAEWLTTALFESQTTRSPRLVPDPLSEGRFHFTFLGDGLGSTWFWRADVEPWLPPNDAVTELVDSWLGLGIITEYATGEGGIIVPSPPGIPPGVSLYSPELPGNQYYSSSFPGASRPLFVARRVSGANTAIERLLGYEMAEGSRRRLALRLVADSWGSPEHGQVAACADAPLAAEAIGVQGAFYFAASSSRPLGQCDDFTDPYGPPTRLQVTLYNQPLGQVLTLMAELQETALIEKVDLTLGEGFLWVTYAVAQSPSEARLKVARVGLTGGILSGPLDVTLLPRPPQFSAARLGPRLAVASVEKTTMGEAIVEVRVLDEDGATAKAFTIIPSSVSGVSMVGEPNGKRLLVALTRGANSEAHGVTMTRYGCL